MAPCLNRSALPFQAVQALGPYGVYRSIRRLPASTEYACSKFLAAIAHSDSPTFILETLLSRHLRIRYVLRVNLCLPRYTRRITTMLQDIELTTSHGNNDSTCVPLPSSRARRKLVGRAFYQSLGSPKMILAPMVDQSEFVRFLHTV